MVGSATTKMARSGFTTKYWFVSLELECYGVIRDSVTRLSTAVAVSGRFAAIKTIIGGVTTIAKTRAAATATIVVRAAAVTD